MNEDHPDDNLLIARAFGYPEATESVMVGLTNDAGAWRATDESGSHEFTVAWPGGPISDRPAIRREVVMVYRAACEKLGVPFRQEHTSEPAAAELATAEQAAAEPAAAEPAVKKLFSQQLREGSWSDHSDSEGSTFMEEIMRGRATRADYVDLAIQHYFMYEALEEVSAEMAKDPKFAPFHPDGLIRMEALVDDLEFLMGANWRDEIEPVPATAAYAARMREVAAEGWMGGVIAHHYTRYLGDLSGGQMISRRVSKQHGFDDRGAKFYDFPELGDLTEFKNQYRVALDAFGEQLTDEERTRVVEEVRAAYAFNTAVFVDLDRAKAAAQA